MFPPAIADGLRRRNIDAAAVQEIPSLRGLADEQIFVSAQLQHRCIVTENVADFVLVEAAWRAEHDQPHAGLVLVSRTLVRRPRSIGRLIDAIGALADAGRPEPGIVAWLE